MEKCQSSLTRVTASRRYNAALEAPLVHLWFPPPYFNSAAEGWRLDKEIIDSALGCNSVSWAPFDPAAEAPQKCLVTGSCDNTVKIHR
jgi:hypothetical protein